MRSYFTVWQSRENNAKRQCSLLLPALYFFKKIAELLDRNDLLHNKAGYHTLEIVVQETLDNIAHHTDVCMRHLILSPIELGLARLLVDHPTLLLKTADDSRQSVDMRNEATCIVRL